MEEESKNILVTGGYGFIGGNFIRFLRDNFPQHRITCIDKDGYASNKDYVKGLCDKEYKLDISKSLELENVFLTNISTDEVYGHLGFNDPSFTELTPIAPRSPYAASKASSDLLCLSYIETFNSNISITRCCNNYGPNQHNEKFIRYVQ